MIDGTQTLIGEATLSAPQHTQAWDGQLALAIGFVVEAVDAVAAAQIEIAAAIANNDDALDNPRADRAAARIRLAAAWQAAHELGLI